MDVNDNYGLERYISLFWIRARFFLIIALIFAIILAVVQCERNERAGAMATNLANSLQSKLKTYVDKDGKNHGRIATLETTNAQQALEIKSSDATINRLLEVIDKNAKLLKKQGAAVAVISTVASVDTVFITKEVIPSETEDCNPTYKSDFVTKEIREVAGKKDTITWIEGKLQMNKDSTKVAFEFNEELDIVIGSESTGFLGMGRPKPFADVKLGNPYNKVKDMRVWKIQTPAPKTIHCGIGTFYGIGSNFTPQIFVGAGVMYSPSWLSF